jgi:hypothetical protein
MDQRCKYFPLYITYNQFQDIKVEKGALSDNVTTPSLDIGTYNGYNFACTSTKAIRFHSGGKDDKIWKFGVFFQGFQV